MKRLLLATTAVAVLAAAALYADDAKDYVIMKVGGDDVKRSEVIDTWKSVFPGAKAPDFDKFSPAVRDSVLRGVASEHLLLKEAQKSNVADSDEVKARMEEAKNQILIQEFLKQKSASLVTDAQVRAAYDDHVKAMGGAGQDEVQLRHIIVKTEGEARGIERRLKRGEDFAKVGAEAAAAKDSGASWGEMGWTTAAKMTPDIAKVAMTLKKGDISPPVKTDFGWQILEAEDTRKFNPPAFDQIKDRLRQSLAMAEMHKYVDGLLAANKIEVFDEQGHESDLAAHPAPAAAMPAPAGAAPAAGMSVAPAAPAKQ